MPKIIDVLKWDGMPDVFAYKFPNDELYTKTQLIVSESQEAVFMKDGQFYGPFGPGLHILDTKNYPFLTALVTNLVSGGISPFSAEVWFVQKAIPLNMKWGTNLPIQLEDPQYHIMIPVRAFGQYGLQIEDSKKFLCKMVGRVPCFTTETLVSYFRGIIVTFVKDCISSYILDKRISILHISNKMREISEYLNERITKEIQTFGLRTVSFTVSAITTDENDPAVVQLKTALAKKAEMNIIGYTYQQERSFDTMETAAGNSGGGGSFINAGIGLGLGTAAGVPMGNIMSNISKNMNLETMTSCPKCAASIPANTKFCPECGNIVHTDSKEIIKCPQCGKNSPYGKFCPECGAKLQRFCISCGTKLDFNTKFCPECGTKQE